ncbi:hypothetical protein JCM10908_000450 [Rhodotorula pacifica]|uniref:uncharacterized protein n=1 Tax=Rhodotorula pacifica TaxID=1495444 RepID=UPI003173B52F
MGSRPVCKFHSTPRGCNKGAACQFLHVTATAGPPAATPPRPRAAGSGQPARGGAAAADASKNRIPQAEWLAGVPRGTCRFFWNDGRCEMGTKCKYKHDQTKADQSATSAQTQSTLPPPRKLTDQELTAIASGTSSDAMVATAGRPAYFSRGKLYRYLAQDGSGRFDNGSRDMYAFVEALLASATEGTSWSSEDASNVILDLKPGSPGLARIAEVVAANISSQAGSSARVLSFQRGFVPLVLYLTSSIVKNSVVVANVNALFSILIANPSWAKSTLDSLRDIVTRKSTSDPNALAGAPSCSIPVLAIFDALGQLLLELMRRFPDAVLAVPELPNLVTGMSTLFDAYSRDILSDSPTFANESILDLDLARRRFALDGVKHTLQTVPKVLERAQVKPIVDALPREVVGKNVSSGVLTMLRALMQPPGELRPGGPRHDNDFADIRQIAILPTPDELTSSADAFIPANLSDMDYHLEGMEGRLDLLFRLMREDFVGPLRAATQSLLVDFEHLDDQHNSLAALLKRGGGRYRPSSSTHGGDSSDLMVYKDVKVVGLDLDRHELRLNLQITLPPGFKSSKQIVRNLAQGNLVALLSFETDSKGKVRNVRDVGIDLGIVAADLESSKLSVNFFDGTRRSIYLDAVRDLAEQKKQHKSKNSATSSSLKQYLVELPGFLVSTVEPFLRALQQLSAPAIPFADILSAKPPTRGQKLRIQPPLYARNPGFEYDLSSILTGEDVQPQSLVLRPSDRDSVQDVREFLAQPGKSRLDPTQAQALVDCLTREIALVEGPPGTGKSFLGVELVRVLLAANVGKILILAFTNHALDDMLKHVYDQVTRDIVRCGSRSEEEPLQAISLYNLLQFRQPQAHGPRQYEIGQKKKKRSEIERDIIRLCAVAQRPTSEITWEHLVQHLRQKRSTLVEAFRGIPADVVEAIDAQEGWYTVGKRAARIQCPEGPDDIFSFWRNGADLDVRRRFVELQQFDREQMRMRQEQAAAPNEDSATKVTNSFAALSIDDDDNKKSDKQDSNNSDSSSKTVKLPGAYAAASDSNADEEEETAGAPFVPNPDEEEWREPATDRPLAALLHTSDIWSFSRSERKRLIEHYTAAVVANKAPDLHNLRRNLGEVNDEIRAFNSEEKLTILNRARIIEATTNGCANVLDLIEKVRPTVVLVEEAGECLEAQIVANLVPSVQHLICIGDHLQLRPHITSYSLSIDSARGKIHRHDVSLFERLAELPIAMSILQTQRRMRPNISKLIRNALYPDLEDAPNVAEYPDVQGMSRNIFFVDHRLQQDAASALHSSQTNSAEARWVFDLVRHLALQGSGASICILTPYLGQLRILRTLLQAVQITTILDERDLGDLEAEEDGEDDATRNEADVNAKQLLQAHAKQQSLNTQVLLRTVDRFQGEEADIIVLSLVRNSKTPTEGGGDGEEQAVFSSDARASIGFLKSPNRTNVAVSRAKHGLFIFGNAALFRSKAPIWESIIHDLEQDGNVGPTLPAACLGHPEKGLQVDGPDQLPQLAPFGGCLEPCTSALPCGHRCPQVCHPIDAQHRHVQCVAPCEVVLDCGHPCSGICSESHPKCQFKIPRVQLVCGHVQKNVECWRTKQSMQLKCTETEVKELPCVLSCAHGTCRGRCSNCKALQRKGDAFGHVQHAHEKIKACGHICKGSCFEHVKTGSCEARCNDWCTRSCSHGTCKDAKTKHACSDPCPSCLQPCDTPDCKLPCASPCNVVPKEVACSARLPKCGCPCPSLKNEPCGRQVCPKHSKNKSQVVDLIMMTTLADFDPTDPDPLQRLITLDCGHAFTVETLDGLFDLGRFFTKKQGEGSWQATVVPSESTAQISCPTCKQLVSSASNVRYRRAIKFAELNNQERLRILRNQEQLEALGNAVDAVSMDDKLAHLVERLRPPKGSARLPESEQVAAQRNSVMAQTAYSTAQAFTDDSLFGLGSFGKAFVKLIRPLLQVHNRIDALVLELSPHTRAYHSAIAALFRAEKQAAAPRSHPLSDEQALRIARLRVGMAPQTSDTSSSLRAVWLATQVRYQICDIVYKLAMRFKAEEAVDSGLVDALLSFGGFVLETINRDLERGSEIAQGNNSKRLQLENALNSLKCAFKTAQYHLRIDVADGRLSRLDARTSSELQRQQSFAAFGRIKSSLLSTSELRALLAGWTKTAVEPHVDHLRDAWEDFEKSIFGGTFYDSVSDDERRMIIQAVAYPTTGHWYTCPNGHPYVIGECGGAMQVSTCPECGARIGGAHHTLDETNRNAREMDDLAVEAGTQRRYFWQAIF